MCESLKCLHKFKTFTKKLITTQPNHLELFVWQDA